MAFSFDNLAGSNSTAVMGIINLSPDSFYSRSSHTNPCDVFHVAEKMIDEGVHILDVGAESTRPGSRGISVKLELERLLPVITKLTKEFNVPISVDTYKPDVASVVLQEGAAVINDISGLGAGRVMANIISHHNAGIVLMHMKGTPEIMQKNPCYEDVCAEVLNFLSQRVKLAEDAGIDSGSIAIDPGIGFGKSPKHNFQILDNIPEFLQHSCPVMVGVSRKFGLHKASDHRLKESISLALKAVQNGISILRVHDVAETRRALNGLIADRNDMKQKFY